ncbi:GMC family oxidoreductase [Kitasatospora albolonga]|uniref:GMC family oxidoreductase n=1 Tax=Kitasatospora albolonga TaxID=68173 RepID=UPI0031E6FF30
MSAGAADRHYDVIVVGSGVAGSLVAARLGALGRRVLVLEAGARPPGTAELLAAQSAGPLKLPTLAFPQTAGAPWPEVTDPPAPGGYLVQAGPLPYGSGYLRATGGTGNVWTGLAPRMLPEDFRPSRYGRGRDWPLDYTALEPWYREAERELGVCADVTEQRERLGLEYPDGYVYPMRALPPSHLDTVMACKLDTRKVTDPVTGELVELRVTGTPQARNGLPHPGYDRGRGFLPQGADGRPDPESRCQGHASCIPHCPSGAKYTPLRTQGTWARSVTLVEQAVVSRVLVDGTGRATGVEWLDHRGEVRRRAATADVVVLTAHAVENAKLLLLSGLANRSGQLGRNLMDHPVLLTWGLMPDQTGPYRGPGSTSGLEGFRTGAGRARRAGFRVEIGNWGWAWAAGAPSGEIARLLREGGPDGRGHFGPELRAAVTDRIGRQFALQFELDQPPDPANRITLHPTLRDPLGLPRPVVRYDVDAYVRDGMAAAAAVSDQLFALLGAEDHTDYSPAALWPGRFERDGRAYAYRGAGHGAGTHLMGHSPADSVVDQWQRCWDHPGLYAVGCGSMPSVATSNPTLTMAALALRSTERIEAELAERDRPATVSPTGVPR